MSPARYARTAVNPGTAQPRPGQESTEPGTDDHGVELLVEGGAPGHVGIPVGGEAGVVA